MIPQNALFVGQDEIANDLLTGLGRPDTGWNLKFVLGGSEALAALSDANYDIIVSELSLADMDAAQLLERVRASHPETVRFVLTGKEDRERMMSAMNHAHQLITKPVTVDKLRMQMSNSLAVRVVLTDSRLHSRIAQINSLPTLPSIYNELVAEMQSETASMQRVANLIKQDVSLTAKLLQMTNSAFFGLSTRVENPLQAANLLGMDTVKSLVLTAGIFNQFDDPGLPGFSVDTIYDHSLSVGTSARHIANALGLGRKPSEDALMAGMLHDIGKLVMLTNFRDELSQALALAKQSNIPLHEAERQIFGVTHCEIGAHLLSLWGLSHLILEAVTLHDTPNLSVCPMINVLTSVHIANAFDYDNNMPDRDPKFTHANVDYLTKLGLNTQINFLRTLTTSAR